MLNVFIDIETIPGPEKPKKSEVSPPGQMKKKETIAKWFAENGETARDDLWKKQALESLKGRIVCIGFAVEDGPVETVYGKDEEELLFRFWGRVKELNGFGDNIRWIGFNLRSFDMNWLYHRAVKYGLKDLAIQIPRKRYADSVVDIREIWNGKQDDRAKGTQDEIAVFLGSKRKTKDMDGSKVFGLWQKGQLSKIGEYCGEDVESVRDEYRKLEGTF
ncbi:ribonuclease H-like domain-containing protein [Maridesulfovibrio sp.]|uniref:ribonuclease H-like domain-containing protein n=1 Tax=Maridesulfovibrio sp. TaxID=2795000 RepID=UPI002AA83A29|nr:ribonuclease H-like domain-containing protein [Maridesulfovibrio sp.]